MYRILSPNFRYNQSNMPDDEVEFNHKLSVMREVEIKEKGITHAMLRSTSSDVLENSLKYFVTDDVKQYFNSSDAVAQERAAEEAHRRELEVMKLGSMKTDWNVTAVVDEDQL